MTIDLDAIAKGLQTRGEWPPLGLAVRAYLQEQQDDQ